MVAHVKIDSSPIIFLIDGINKLCNADIRLVYLALRTEELPENLPETIHPLYAGIRHVFANHGSELFILQVVAATGRIKV